MKKKIAFVALALLVVSSYFIWNYVSTSHGDQKVAYEPSKKECFASKSGKWKFCIHYAKQGTNSGIAYLLHGRNLDEQTWNDDTYYTSMLQRYWADAGIKPPTIVTVSFGPIWLLAPKGGSENSGLLEVLKTEVLSEVESRISKPSYRAIFGESMGGLNSLIAGLSSQKLFQKVAALCPAVYKVSPFAPISELKEAMERTGAEPRIIFAITSIAKAHASSEAEWDKMAPLKLLDSVDPTESPEFYVSSPLYDKYGSYEGTEEFAIKAKQRGLKVSWHPLYGGHCAIDIISLGDFLL